MSHHVDARAWPLLRLRQSGCCSAEDVRALTDALTAAIHRAATESRPFVVVLDYRARQAPTGGPHVDADTFWQANGAAMARWCSAMVRLDPDGTVTVARAPCAPAPVRVSLGPGADR